MAESPSGQEAHGLRPVVVSATRIGAMLVDVRDDAAVLARAELIPLVHGQDEIAFRNLEPRLELSGVLNFVHVDFRGPADRADVLRVVVEMVPAFGVVQPPAM